MDNKKLTLALLAVSGLIILGYLGFKFINNSDSSEIEEMSPVVSVFTTAEVGTHNLESDCWTVVEGNVYDITDYIPRHPGGDEILRACGTDGTSLFNQRTTAEGVQVGSGTPHSASAGNQLEGFFIGQLGVGSN